MNSKVDDFFQGLTRWKAELELLRKLVLECGLTETYKWRQPCYTFEDGNLAMVAGFKNNCALSFFKGALLDDPHGLLVAPGENSQTVRLIPFTSVAEIERQADTIKAYLYEAMEKEKAGLKVEMKAKEELELPEELEVLLEERADLRVAFEGLTPGRQRGYVLYFSAPKQSKTRVSRIEKYIPKILSGKGFHDCTCGLSKRMPTCDGSHKQLESK